MLFERALRMSPRAAEAYVGLADVRLRQDQIDNAVALLSKAIEIDPSYRVGHFLLSSAYQRQGLTEESEKERKLGQQGKVRFLADPLTPRIEKYAATVRARHTLGMRQMMAGNAKEAAILFEAAARTDGNNSSILNSLAGAYMQLGRTDDALQALQRALKVDSNNSTTCINLANWYLYSNQLEAALTMAQAAVEHGPRVATAHRVLIETLLRLKRVTEASEAYERAKQEVPDDPLLRALQSRFDRLRS